MPPTITDSVVGALTRLGRSIAEAGQIAEAIRRVERRRLEAPGLDVYPSLHESAFMSVFSDAGLDDELSNEIYAFESDPLHNQFASDARRTLRALHESGVLIGIVSDIHFDIRPAFKHANVHAFVSSYSLSYEVGAQKPDRRIYDHALASLSAAPEECLMVGDRSVPDGGAVESGITTILLPPLVSSADERLAIVLAAVGLAVK